MHEKDYLARPMVLYMHGDHEKPTISLEAVASQDLWFWHAYFGSSGCNNDLNVLDQSPIFDNVINGNAPDSSCELRGHRFIRGYYLGDEIYPEWSTIVKFLSFPEGVRRTTYKTAHDAARKDIERVFGLLKNKWHIVSRPSRIWSQTKMRHIMYACVIMHNMIIEDTGRANCEFIPNKVEEPIVQVTEAQRIANIQDTQQRNSSSTNDRFD